MIVVETKRSDDHPFLVKGRFAADDIAGASAFLSRLLCIEEPLYFRMKANGFVCFAGRYRNLALEAGKIEGYIELVPN